MSAKYPQRRVDGELFYVHRKVWEDANGTIPDGMDIDHINGDTHDNRIENLRCVTRSQNHYNKKSKGYGWHKGAGKWCAWIFIDKKQKHLGLFNTEEGAAQARKDAYDSLLGENFNGRV